MRTCTKCGSVKPDTEFYVTRRDPQTREPITRKRQCKVCTARKAKTWRKSRAQTDPVDRETGTMLPIGPFRQWLLEQLESTNAGDLAAALKVSDRRLYAWLKVVDRIHIDYADRVLLEAGRWLWEVYPELYVFDEEAQAA